MNVESPELALLGSIVPELEAEGFEVYTNPSRRVLPPFLREHRLDAIALRKDKKLAIEVLREGAASQRKLDQIRNLLSGQDDWELRVYWVRPSNIPAPVEGASRRVIERSIGDIKKLVAEGHTGPALPMSRATFEAVGRALLP